MDGEKTTLKNKNYVIIRTNIFGFNKPLRASIAEWALKSFQNGDIIHGFSDVLFNSIYTRHLADCLLEIVEINFQGLINIASSKEISKYEFLKYLGLKSGYPNITLKKSSIDRNSSNIRRPKNTTLNVSKASKLITLPTVNDGIDQLVTDYFSENERD